MTNEERSIDALIAAFRPLIEGAAKAARQRRASRGRRRPSAEELGASDDLDIDWSEHGCLCFRCAPCAWCMTREGA